MCVVADTGRVAVCAMCGVGTGMGGTTGRTARCMVRSEVHGIACRPAALEVGMAVRLAPGAGGGDGIWPPGIWQAVTQHPWATTSSTPLG